MDMLEKLELYIKNTSKNELGVNSKYWEFFLELIRVTKEQKRNNLWSMDDWFDNEIKSFNNSDSYWKLMIWLLGTIRELEKK